jgi:hypothetical protein
MAGSVLFSMLFISGGIHCLLLSDEHSKLIKKFSLNLAIRIKDGIEFGADISKIVRLML